MVTIIFIPITAIVVGFFVLFSVRLGLKWNVQLQKGEQLEKVIENPVIKVMEKIYERKHEEEVADIMDEYLNGKKG